MNECHVVRLPRDMDGEYVEQLTNNIVIFVRMRKNEIISRPAIKVGICTKNVCFLVPRDLALIADTQIAIWNDLRGNFYHTDID